MLAPTITNFAPNGMIQTKDLTPHVPISVSEVVEDDLAAYECGITMTHIHARDQQTGIPTYDAEIYGLTIEGIRRYAPELIIYVSLSGCNSPEFEKHEASLQLDGNLKPDMGSLTHGFHEFPAQDISQCP